GIVQSLFYARKFQDATYFCHVQVSVVEGHTVGGVETTGDDPLLVGPEITIRVPDGIYLVSVPAADENSSGRADRQRPCMIHRGEYVDRKPRRKCDLVERKVCCVGGVTVFR